MLALNERSITIWSQFSWRPAGWNKIPVPDFGALSLITAIKAQSWHSGLQHTSANLISEIEKERQKKALYDKMKSTVRNHGAPSC